MFHETSITPSRISRHFVETRCSYFSDIHLWPREAILNPAAWLSNFNELEADHAVHLLGAFLYFSSELTAVLFKAAFHSLSSRLGDLKGPFVKAQATWTDFRRSVIVTRVTGEIPNDTDSGYLFARMTRQQLDLDESQIKSNRDAMVEIMGSTTAAVVFVDDFVGSGDQFVATWQREIEVEPGLVTSFKRLSQLHKTTICYCPIFVAEAGRGAIEKECPEVLLAPAHYLPANYSLLADDSVFWPDHLRPTAFEFLESASRRAGIGEWDWMGYKDQGLALGFEHGVPDATLPIYYHEENGWKPLIRRR